MSEIAGLRPAREQGTAWPELPGAYALYCHDNFAAASGNTTYRLAKWISLAAGEYVVSGVADDSGTFALDGAVKAEFILGSGVTSAPFTVATSGVFRLDLTYLNAPDQTLAWVAYTLKKADGTLIEVSRADGFIGDIRAIPDSALGTKPIYGGDERLTYPVFLPRPNWANGISVYHEWKTDILISETGAEQRRRLRVSPRRAFEGQFQRWGRWANLMDQAAAAIGRHNALVPSWTDETAVVAESRAGDTFLYGNLRNKEFTPGGIVIVRRDRLASNDPFDYELAVIQSASDDAIGLTQGISKDVPIGATITPVHVCQLRDSVGSTLMTDNVASASFRFWQVDGFTRPASWGDMPIYNKTGLHILTLRPDFSDPPTRGYDRHAYTLDLGTGPVSTVDPGNQSATNTRMVFHLDSRAKIRAFEQLMFAMAGRHKTFHLPTWANDATLTRNVVPSEGALVVRRSGVSLYTDADQAIRTDILIQLYDGTLLPNTVISARSVGDEEWLYLSETTPALDMASVKRISYMPVSRLDVDSIELLMPTAEVATVALTFKSFQDRRNV